MPETNETPASSIPPGLYVVGIGPGGLDYMCGRAVEVLKSVEVVAGYTTYIDLIRPLISGKEVVRTGMMKEVDRVAAAIDAALAGKTCALVSSGDPGIYAMAGLVFDMCRERDIALSEPGGAGLFVEVVPGIPALAAGAALLGAPLTHDFAAVSLSDLLTPWETIEKRIEAAAAADFVLAIYNPRSKKRDWQLGRAVEILLAHRSPETPVGVVTAAMRAEQSVAITTLGAFDPASADMQTTVFIGNSHTFRYGDRMVTPRGYARKYDMVRS
ncbi:MAG: precorrin-3B C(17)-methyltransferase [Thermodesulfobacteriota bacterium]